MWLLFSILLCWATLTAHAQVPPKKKNSTRRSISSSMPSGYVQVGNTDLCYNKSAINWYGENTHSIDIQGKFGSNYYGSTYANGGYRVAMQVGDNIVDVDCLNGTTVNGVKFESEVMAQADLARVCYYITNTNERDTIISLGIHADVMIGNNDGAPIIRKVDTIGNTYGLALLDGNGAQLCVLFGSGLTGVTGVSDFWFGCYYLNSETYAMVGNYSSGDCYMVENGSYDSGMGWCWKNRTIPAGATVTFSWLIGVGEVNLEPNSSFEVTPEDPDGWNDLSRLHVLALEGDYESPAGLSGRIEYAVEDSEEWIALTEMLESGSTFNDTVRAMFNPDLATHTIRFRTVDQVGNTTLLPSIVYPDVSYHAISGVSDMTYTGEPLFQTNISCDLNEGHYALKNYQNNVNVGTASFNVEGVFPYTIGRKTYHFAINPQPLSGNLVLNETSFVYNGNSFTPQWQFSNGDYANLEYNRDYTLAWSNNRLPGTATLTVTGKGNYTGTLSATFAIDKAPLTNNLYVLTLPEEDVTYDEQGHGATISKSNGVGDATFTYTTKGQTDFTTQQPVAVGEYDIYLEIADGSLYYGMSRTKVGSFAIFQFDAAEWEILQTIKEQLVDMGWSQPWDVSQGMKGVSSIQGLTIEKGHVIGIDLEGQNLEGAFPFALFALPQLSELNLSHNNLSGDVGTGLADYCLQNSDVGLNLKELNISYNQFTGNVGLLCKNLTALQSLKASNNQLSEVYPMIPLTVTEVDLGGQNLNEEFPLHLGNQPVASLVEQLPNILFYKHQQQTYATDLEFTCEHEGDGWNMTMGLDDLLYNKVVTTDYVIGQQTCMTEKGADSPWEFVDRGQTFLISTDGKTYTTGYQNTVKYSRNHNYTITVPEGLTAYAVRFIGYSNADTEEDCAYMSQFDGVDVPENEIIRFNARNQDDGDARTVPMVTTRFVLAVPRTGGEIMFRFSGQQAAAIIVVECAEANSKDSTVEPLFTSISFSCNEGQNVYRGQSGDLFAITANKNTAAGSKLNMRLKFDEGDANFNGQFNVLDLQTTINYMFEEYATKPFNFTAANLWPDDIINVQDVVGLVNLLFATSPSEPNSISSRSQTEMEEQVEAFVFCRDGKLVVNTAQNVAAFDIILADCEKIDISNELKQMGIICESRPVAGGLRLMGYSLSGATIPAGEAVIGHTTASSVVQCVLANKEANEISSAVNNDQTTGVSTIVLFDELQFDNCYDLQGRKVVKPTKGLYIVDGKKIFVNEKQTTK